MDTRQHEVKKDFKCDACDARFTKKDKFEQSCSISL